MGKAQAVLDLFPCPYAMREPRKLIRHVVEALAQPIEEADSHLFRIQRAHRLEVADHAHDILHLAAALDLTEIHFADLLADERMPYEERLRLMRRRVRRVARLHLEGAGTPWAAMEAAAIFLDAEVIPPRGRGRRMRTLDAEGFSHRAVLESLRGEPGRRAPIYLHENPRRRHKVDPADRWPLLDWGVRNESVSASPARLAVRGVAVRTVSPAIICPTSGQGLRFEGIIPAGATLVVDEDGARLDGMPVDDWVTFFQGGIHDYSDLDEATAVTQTPASARRPFDADRGPVPPSPIRRPRPVPNVPLGSSRWFLQVDEGVFDGDRFDYSVFETPHLPVGHFDSDAGYGESVFYYPPSGVAGMAWDERIPCAFKLTLPPGWGSVPPEEERTASWVLGDGMLAAPDDQAPATDADGAATTRLTPAPDARVDRRVAARISTLLPRFKAAGIRSFVQPAQRSWTLGSGVLRSGTARWGEGVATDGTHLADPYADTLVQV